LSFRTGVAIVWAYYTSAPQRDLCSESLVVSEMFTRIGPHHRCGALINGAGAATVTAGLNRRSGA
jgi:hypothetical protein